MKEKQAQRSLKLNRETIRLLNHAQMKHALGGMPPTCDYCTIDCTIDCTITCGPRCSIDFCPVPP